VEPTDITETPVTIPWLNLEEDYLAHAMLHKAFKDLHNLYFCYAYIDNVLNASISVNELELTVFVTSNTP